MGCLHCIWALLWRGRVAPGKSFNPLHLSFIIHNMGIINNSTHYLSLLSGLNELAHVAHLKENLRSTNEISVFFFCLQHSVALEVIEGTQVT